jgi:hypothetical protein
MAEIMNSLFGVTPESLQAQRYAQDQKEALAYANFNDPFARANYQIYQGASGLGRQISGLLGAQDPEMAKAAALQSILKQADTTTAEGYNALARTLAQQGFGQQASQAAQQALGMREKEAVISKNLRERAAADPFQQFLRSAVGKVTPESIAAYQQSGNVADLDWVEKPNQTEIARLQAYRSTLPEGSRERSEVEAVIKATAEGRGTKITVAPEIKQAPDIVGAVGAFDKATEKEVAMMESAGLAKQLINQTAKSNNSQAWEAARTTVAKAAGENKLSNEDIRRTGVDPRLVEGALDWVNKKIQGAPNQDIQKQLFVLSSVLENNAKARYDAKASRTRAAAEATGFKGNVQTYFPKAAERSNTVTPNAVDWSSLK